MHTTGVMNQLRERTKRGARKSGPEAFGTLILVKERTWWPLWVGRKRMWLLRITESQYIPCAAIEAVRTDEVGSTNPTAWIREVQRA